MILLDIGSGDLLDIGTDDFLLIFLSASGDSGTVYDVPVEDRVLVISEDRISDVLVEDRVFEVNP